MRRAFSLGFVVLLIAAVSAGTASAAKPIRLPLHTRVLFSGQTLGSGSAAHTTGAVVATASWKGRPVYVFASPRTDAAGRWSVKFHPSYLGRYTVRILPPGGATSKYVFTVY